VYVDIEILHTLNELFQIQNRANPLHNFRRLTIPVRTGDKSMGGWEYINFQFSKFLNIESYPVIDHLIWFSSEYSGYILLSRIEECFLCIFVNDITCFLLP
jgi:hypothetical protein